MSIQSGYQFEDWQPIYHNILFNENIWAFLLSYVYFVYFSSNFSFYATESINFAWVPSILCRIWTIVCTLSFLGATRMDNVCKQFGRISRNKCMNRVQFRTMNCYNFRNAKQCGNKCVFVSQQEQQHHYVLIICLRRPVYIHVFEFYCI